jgi:hypothetical protein
MLAPRSVATGRLPRSWQVSLHFRSSVALTGSAADHAGPQR